LADHGVCYGLQDVAALLSRGQEVAASAGERSRAFKRSETPGYFKAELDHADILLSQIVGEGDVSVMKKR